jgi:hypothetical protein
MIQVRESIREMSKGTLLVLIAGVFVVVTCLVIGSMFVFGFGLFSQKTANFRGETSKRNRVEANGAYRIAAYDHFFDLCAGVQTKEATIKALLDEKKAGTTPERLTIIAASLTGLRSGRASDINQYNVDARKSYTLAQFRASDLPFTLDPLATETTCTSSSTSAP